MHTNLSRHIAAGEIIKPWLMLGPFYEDLSATVQGLTLFEKPGATVGRTAMTQIVGEAQAVLAARPVEGEETTFHAVDRDSARGKNGWEDVWQKRYSAGIMLLDLDEPHKVIGMSKLPLLAPEAPYEVAGGFRNHAIFPGGMILEQSGEVKIYYGAADTAECLATADIGDLLALCAEKRR